MGLLPSLMLQGCAQPDQTPQPGEPGLSTTIDETNAPMGTASPWRDTLVEGNVGSAANDGGTGWVYRWDDATWWWTSTAEEPVQLALDAGEIQAAATTAEGLWFVRDELLFLHDGVLVPVVWPLSAPITSLHPDGERLWISAGGLLVRQQGLLTELQVEGAPVLGPTAPGARLGGQPVAWVGHGEVALALDVTGSVVEGVTLDVAVDGVAADRTGGAWVSAGGILYSRFGADDWREVPLEGPAWRLFAHPRGAGLWVESDQSWFFLGPDRRDHVDTELLGVDSDVALDSLGRLGLITDAGLERLAVDRPVEILGPPEGTWVEWATEIALLPAPSARICRRSRGM